MPADGRGEPQLIQYLRPQPRGDLPHGLDGTVDHAKHRFHSLGEHPLIPGAPSSVPEEVDFLLNLLDAEGEVRPLEDIEAQAIRFALSRYRGQMSEAARRLRIGRSTLYRKLDLNNLPIADHENA